MDGQQQALEDAVSFYYGDLLPACYDEWIAPERERLRHRLIEALEQLVQLCEDQRSYLTAIHYAQQLLQQDPLHEATYRRLMRLYMLADNRAAALQTYQTCLALLQQELGVKPGPETQHAYAQLLAMEIPAVPHPRRDRVVSGTAQLVGRHAEWQKLHTAWQQTMREGPRFVLINGEAGIGKTHLAEELLIWAERQAIPTARTRAYAAGRELAYAPVVEWLQSAPLQLSLAAVDELRLAEVALLLPELLTTRPTLAASVSPPTADLSQWQRQRLFDALTHLLLADRKPKLLLIDDLQWCDSETLTWLRYLFAYVYNGMHAGADAAQTLIVGTMRPEEVESGDPLMDLLIEVRGTAQITEIDLTPLSEAETAELAKQVAEHTIDAIALDTLFGKTGGNPLFVVEMVRAGLIAPSGHSPNDQWSQQEETSTLLSTPRLPLVLPQLPPKMLAVIKSRLNRLSPGARQLATIAAVIGRAFTFSLVYAVSDEDENTVVNQLDELWQRGIVRSYGSQMYDFSHDRIRDVAYASMSPVQRPRLHQQVAQALERLHINALDPLYARLAYHYELAGDFARAITNYRQAADVAHRRFADADAVALLTQALTWVTYLPTPEAQKNEELSLLLQLLEPMLVSRGYLAPELGEIGKRATVLAQELDHKRELLAAMASLRGYEQMSGRYSSALACQTDMCFGR
ncbi:MAG: AAA family ATPase [Caldilineaceae bacterium]